MVAFFYSIDLTHATPPVRAEVTAVKALIVRAAADLKSAQETRSAMDILHEAGGSAPSASHKRKATGVVKSKTKVLREAEETLARLKENLDALDVKRKSLDGSTDSDLTDLDEDDAMQGVAAAPLASGPPTAAHGSLPASKGGAGLATNAGATALVGSSLSNDSATPKSGAAPGVNVEGVSNGPPMAVSQAVVGALSMNDKTSTVGAPMLEVQSNAAVDKLDNTITHAGLANATDKHKDVVSNAGAGDAMDGVELGTVASTAGTVSSSALVSGVMSAEKPPGGGAMGTGKPSGGVTEIHKGTVSNASTGNAMDGVELGAVASTAGTVGSSVLASGVMGAEKPPGGDAMGTGKPCRGNIFGGESAMAGIVAAGVTSQSATSSGGESTMAGIVVAEATNPSATSSAQADGVVKAPRKLKASEVLKRQAKELRDEARALQAKEKAERELLKAQKKAKGNPKEKKKAAKVKGLVSIDLKNEDGTLEGHSLHKIDTESGEEGEGEGEGEGTDNGESRAGTAGTAPAEAVTTDGKDCDLKPVA